MSKAKKPTKPAEEKKKTAKETAKPKAAEKKVAAKPAKPAARTPSKTPEKKAVAAETAKIEKKAVKSKAQPAKNDKTQAKTAKESLEKSTSEVSLTGFSHAGLGVKTASKKPGLSIAPGIMILGKTSSNKTEDNGKASERKLSKKELADIKSFLLEKRERLLAGMRRELAVQRERAESKAADEVDKATDAYDEDLSFEIAIANDQELGEIQVALEKIDKGTYGECEICGCTISPSRLKILPSATTCVSCRGQEEMARRRDDGNLLFSMMGGDDGETETGES